MAKLPSVLPTRDDLGQMPSARTGRNIARLDIEAYGAPGRGLANIGRGLASLGASLSEQDQNNENAEVQRRLIENETEQERRLEESRRNMSGSGEGFTDSAVSSYDEAGRGVYARAREAGLSPQALQRLDIGLLRQRNQISGRATHYESTARDAFANTQTREALRGIEGDAILSPDRINEHLDRGRRLLDASRMSPSARESAWEHFRTNTQRAVIEQRAAQVHERIASATASRDQEELNRALQDLETLQRDVMTLPRRPSEAQPAPGAQQAPGAMRPEMSLDDEMAADRAPERRSDAVEIQPVPGGRTPAGARPRESAIEGIVLHHTSGSTLQGALSQNQIARTGYNYYVDRDGSVYQFAPDDQRMNHIMPSGHRDRIAGAWSNLSSDNTIGIGVVARNDSDITDAQRDTLRRLTGQLSAQHNIANQNIVGHGDLQHTRERDEGSTAREFREGRVRTAQLPSRSDATPGGGFNFSDRAPYDLSVAERQTVLNTLRTRFRAMTIPLLRQGLESIVNGDEPTLDTRGRTALDIARTTMTPLQIQRWEEQWSRARNLRDATAPLYTMRPDQMGEYVANLPTSIRPAISRRSDRLLELYQSDPARAVSGGDLAGSDRRPPVTIDPETGTPSVVSITGNEDIRLPSHPSVRAAYDTIRFNTAARERNIPERVSFGVNEDGEVVVTTPEGEPRRLRQDEWRTLIEGRLAAQRALGIPDYQQAPITRAEAEKLLAMPRRMTDDEFSTAMRAAVDRAHEQYGPYARMALETALRYRANITNEQAESARPLLRSLVSGESLRREDIERTDRLMQLDRERAAWLGSDRIYPSQEFQGLGIGPRMVAPPPVARQPEQPRGWFQSAPAQPQAPGYTVEPRMTLGGIRDDLAMRRGGATGIPSASNVPTRSQQTVSPGLGVSYPRPTPQDVSDLQRYPDLQQDFDTRFGPGAAATYLQGQAPQQRR